MLQLTRYTGQRIVVVHEKTGDKLTIEVTDLSADRQQVRLGLSAPKTFLIDREEVHLRKKGKRK